MHGGPYNRPMHRVAWDVAVAAVVTVVTVGVSVAQPFSGASEDLAYSGLLVITVLLMRRAWRSSGGPDGGGGPEGPGPLDGHHGGFGGHGGGHC
jgi:hypothetical protein